ncbi:nitrate/nitrite transporter [Rhodococcus sp. NPDC057529]|uniref:MFS transporter n=1 Tax=Rhodococcus sp. NPDC057529 TaxID=3346158 RepID=UPI00366F0FF9
MTTIDGSDVYQARWRMLALLALGYVSLTLNWFNIASAFTPISDDLGVTFAQLAMLIALFVLGYGVAHVPGGILAARYGMKRTLVAGMLLQGVGAILSGFAIGFIDLALYRVIAGVGASIVIAVGVGAVSVWFRDREINLALGVTSGAAFSTGVILGLYACIYLTEAAGWRGMLIICGVLNIVLAAAVASWFRTPPGVGGLAGGKISRAGLVQALVDKQLWIYGIAMVGVYGAYFTASQLLGTYAVEQRGFTAGEGGMLGAVFAFAGIPGALIGGKISDLIRNYRVVIVVPLLAMGGLLAAIPVAPDWVLWGVSFAVGFLFCFSFPAWVCVPAAVSKVDPEQVGTAVGVMLTLAAVGGFVVPVVFGYVVPEFGFGVGWTAVAAISLLTGVVGLVGKKRADHPVLIETVAAS